MTLLSHPPTPEWQQLLQSPRLRLYADALADFLAAETAQRQQFYSEISEDDKAEFINGQIVMHSPVKLWHNVASIYLASLLNAYVSKHDLGFAGHEKIMIALTRNDYEPDVCFFEKEKADAFTGKQMLFPAPDFIAEVLSPSTEKYDRGIKFDDYAAHGVREYWIIDPDEQTVEQYELVGRAYQLRFKVGDGRIESRVVTGFALPVSALFEQRCYFETLQQLVK